MSKQIQSDKSHLESQFYIKYNFSLSDLIDLIPSSKIFSIQTYEIELNLSENFTFGTDIYTIKLPSHPDNYKRILYYSLLCYIFQMCNDSEASKYQQVFMNYVLNQIQVILPYKLLSTKDQKIGCPMMTTNQIKASFAKFIALLRQRQKKQKMVFQQISTLPQIDFIFMSIFQMYVRKNQNCIEEGLQKLFKDFGIRSQLQENGFILNGQCEIQRKSKNSQWDKFLIKKIDIKKNNTSISFKRKDTIQSVGEIQEPDSPQTQQQINEKLHYDELINARFVESCESQDVQKLYQQALLMQKKQRVTAFNFVKDKLFMKKQKFHEVGNQIIIPKKPMVNGKRISFLNQNSCFNKPLSHIKPKFQQRSKLRIKTDVSMNKLINNKQSQLNNFRPWSPKPRNSTKGFLFSSNQGNQKAVENTNNSKVKISFCSQTLKQHSQSIKQNKFQTIKNTQKRHTLQKLTFKYGASHIPTI